MQNDIVTRMFEFKKKGRNFLNIMQKDIFI